MTDVPRTAQVVKWWIILAVMERAYLLRTIIKIRILPAPIIPVLPTDAREQAIIIIIIVLPRDLRDPAFLTIPAALLLVALMVKFVTAVPARLVLAVPVPAPLIIAEQGHPSIIITLILHPAADIVQAELARQAALVQQQPMTVRIAVAVVTGITKQKALPTAIVLTAKTMIATDLRT